MEAMRRCWEENHYLVCPHTAVAVWHHYNTQPLPGENRSDTHTFTHTTHTGSHRLTNALLPLPLLLHVPTHTQTLYTRTQTFAHTYFLTHLHTFPYTTHSPTNSHSFCHTLFNLGISHTHTHSHALTHSPRLFLLLRCYIATASPAKFQAAVEKAGLPQELPEAVRALESKPTRCEDLELEEDWEARLRERIEAIGTVRASGSLFYPTGNTP